jgi:hypothetical protein
MNAAGIGATPATARQLTAELWSRRFGFIAAHHRLGSRLGKHVEFPYEVGSNRRRHNVRREALD